MKRTVTIVGVGEVGGVFARGFLKCGYPVYPVTRTTPLDQLPAEWPDPEAVIVGVGEKDLQTALGQLPPAWYERAVLLQNELLPKDWTAAGLKNPTVISVWFEKKQPHDYKVIIPSPVFGPKAELVAEALGALNIATKVCQTAEELLQELILKNLYILTTNVCGLKVGGTVGELWEHHQDFARRVANEVLDIQFRLAGQEFARDDLIAGMQEAFAGDPQHKCMGRSAPARLERALKQAQELGLEIDTLQQIAMAQK